LERQAQSGWARITQRENRRSTMTELRHRLFGATLVLFIAMTAGCASSAERAPTAGAGEPGVTEITVDNMHSAAEDMELYITPDGGVGRTKIGDVPRGETRSFRFDGSTGPYRLIAVRPVATTTSERVTINHSSNLTWIIQQNRVVVSRR
jgi:hypothetical protein